MKTRIIPTWGLGSPAAVDIDACHQILVDPLKWPLIPRQQKKFIIEHELAHCAEGVETELEADALAFARFIRKGGKPKDAYKAITQNLPLSDPQTQKRAAQIVKKTHSMKSRTLKYFGPDTLNPTPDPTPDPAPVDSSGFDSDDWKDILAGLFSAAPAIINAATGQPYGPNEYPSNYPPQVPQTNYWPIVLGAGGLLFVGLLAVLIFKK